MNKQQLAAAIWEAANKMRSKIEANEYKDYILGFIFYKFLSDNEERFLRKGYYSDDDIKITVKDGVITIASDPSWKERLRKRMEARKLIASEISLPEFSRSFSLPEDSDQAGITADSGNGILTITIPRVRKAEPGRIEVKIGK